MKVDPSVQPIVLILDDEKNIREAIDIALRREGIKVIGAHDVSSALRALNEHIVDLMIVDIRLGEIDGIAFFKRVRADGFDVPTIFISGHATLTEAAQAVKIGGFDFLEKPFSAEKIAITVKRGLEMSALQERLRMFENDAVENAIVGESRAIRQAISEVTKVSGTNASVLIVGESGTGKELIANSIHAQSARCSAPFVKVNCSAIPEALVESELFGHEKGAFTGAVVAKKGLFEIAHRGTIFLDEVADLSLAAQAKILRVLQIGELQKVGAERTIKVDVRVLSGTHKDLEQAVRAGAFREDLYYRLNVVPIRVPSLRERPDDIPLLIGFFLKQLCARNNLKEKIIDGDVILEMRRYGWPGNVRELQNVLERMLIMSGESITLDDLPDHMLANSDSVDGNAGSLLRERRDSAEREAILTALQNNNGNVTLAANDLQVRRTYLHRRIAILKIAKKDYF